MLYAIDIDSTIAIDTNGCARYLNDTLGMGISTDILRNIDAYWQFAALPAVKEFRLTYEDLYQAALDAADHAPSVIATMIPIVGAVDAVNELAQQDNRVIYVTCRLPTEMDITRAWLTQHGFPAPERVVSCQNYHWKYIHAHEAAGYDEQIVLIDDMMEKVVRSFGQVARSVPTLATNLLKRLEVVGFGLDALPNLPKHMPFACSLLPSWQPEHMAEWLARTRAVQHAE